jgi:SAM-dependent methyltransferase
MNRADRPPPDWQLPPGVNRGLWDYLQSPEVARNYDSYLSGSSLPTVDVAFVLAHCSIPGRLLDMGCGTGRLLVAAARHGHWVLGVDLSAAMLEAAGEKSKSADAGFHCIRANIAELDCLADQSFDGVACLFSTLGMVVGADQRRRVVQHAYHLLRPGGRFVLHVHNRWFNFWTAFGRSWLLRDGWRRWCGRRDAGDCVMPVHQGVAGLTLHLFTRREALRLLRGAGFAIREVRPLSLRPDGRLPLGWWFGGLRAYGYLIAAERPIDRPVSPFAP